MQREVIKWLQSLDLSNVVQNPKRDLATGHAAAEIVNRYSGSKYINLQLLPNGVSAATKRDVWLQVYNALQKLNCQSVTPQLIDAVLRREPNAALTVLECLYEHFTEHTLPMRGLDAVGTSRNAYVQPTNAASTAKLLAVAVCDAPASLYGPLDKAKAVQGSATAGRVATVDRKLANPTDTSSHMYDREEEEADEDIASPDHATRVLQQRLALIDNDELAGGANALQAYPRYARPTASTLVHTASGTRKDVVLDRPKYVADETQQRAQNARIAQQHAVVRRLQEEKTPPQQLGGDTFSSSWPVVHNANGSTHTNADDHLPLTTVYRGRFYREPEAANAKATSTKAVKAGKQGKAGKKKARELAESDADALLAAADEADERDRGNGRSAASCGVSDDALRSTYQEKVNGGGGANNSRAVPKLRVKVHSPALKTALALRSDPEQLRERAATLSRELFAKHHYMLRPALSEVLADVLGAHKQLEHLLDCSSEDGSGEVMENVLGHMLTHRQAFPLSCMKACWDSIGQHVDGIVATLQHTPDEYSYLIESFAFAFTHEAAQVPVLQFPLGASANTPIVDGYSNGGHFGDAECNGEGGNAKAASASGEHDKGDGTRESATSPSHSSANIDATASTRRTSKASAFSPTDSTLRAQSSASAQQQQQPQLSTVAVNARQQMDMASVFHLLSSIARQLDVATAAYVLRRYVLRAARPFLLRYGTAAVQEAVARLVSATFARAAPSHEETITSPNLTISVAGETNSEAGLAEFLAYELAACMQVSSHTSLVSRRLSCSTPPGAGEGKGVLGGKSGRCPPSNGTVGAALQRQRMYWHVFQKCVADFLSSETCDYALPVPPTADGALARCVHAAAETCLDSRNDAEIRTVGVRLVVECCERWWRQAKDEDPSARQDASGGFPRRSLHALISRVLVLVDPKNEGDMQDAAVEGTVSLATSAAMRAVWWNTQATETWELRLMVLRLCTTLLKYSLRNSDDDFSKAANGHTDGNKKVYRAADAAASVCLSTFAAAASAAAGHNTSFWQLQLALASVGSVVDPVRTPSLTAAWKEALMTAESPSTASSDLNSVLIPKEGLAVEFLLGSLQVVGGVRSFLSLKPQPLPSSLVGTATSLLQRTESLLSAGRLFRSNTDSRAANDASRCGSMQSTRTQRNTAQSVLGDTGSPLSVLSDYSPVLQLVCGHVQSVYVLLPPYHTWPTQDVVDTILSPLSPHHARTASATASGSSASGVSSLQLQVLLVALASSPLNSKIEDSVFWLSVMRRLWPLIRVVVPSRAALEALSVFPPAFIQLQQLEDASVDVIAILLVLLFLRCADESTVASTVAAAGESWRALCDSVLQWMEMAVDELDAAS
ncbi:hypothetical protein ABL78_0829 [Leptomonas seymouri]|uniref:Calponin-homology (CH) domain-containing protein n=1 Tax=Leptomonas seymouri TaxID=5684 RepID=A0A0N0P8L1_LEPSE|nr:hypothetical protein ABL78_0829 [Leptomonas seymouri]|eukprot:KPI90076.1 hypothetical protein ABL78_0829 [Leptomonas seymouri]